MKQTTYIVVLGASTISKDSILEVVQTEDGVPTAAFLAANRHGYNGPVAVYGPDGVERGSVKANPFVGFDSAILDRVG